jgi:hypothetical protein
VLNRKLNLYENEEHIFQDIPMILWAEFQLKKFLASRIIELFQIKSFPKKGLLNLENGKI